MLSSLQNIHLYTICTILYEYALIYNIQNIHLKLEIVYIQSLILEFLIVFKKIRKFCD